MKPLSKCPYCGGHLKSVKQNEMWYEKFCEDRCTMRYHQFFDGDFTSDKLRYITFETLHFNVYIYFEGGFHPNIIHFYSKKELMEKGKAGPVVENLPSNRIPIQPLEEMDKSRYQTITQAREWLDMVDEKLHMYALFS